jgi:ubiquinone/menaquinone biosynthesis C-methylase UbiE
MREMSRTNESVLQETIYRLDGPLRSVLGETEQLLSMVRWFPGCTVLDLGAGTGYLSLNLAHAAGIDGQVHCVDVCGGLLRVLEEKATRKGVGDRIHTHQGSALHLDFPDDSFDFVFSSYLLHELEDGVCVALQEIRRVLKPMGEVVLADYRRIADVRRCREIEDWYQAQADGGGPKEQHLRFSLDEVETMLSESGFHNIRLRSWLDFHVHAAAGK